MIPARRILPACRGPQRFPLPRGSALLLGLVLGLLGATPARGAVLRSIFVSPVSATLSIASTRQFKAYANFSDGSILDVTTSAEWSTSSTKIAVVQTTMPGRGTVTATGPGTARISAALVQENGSKTKGSADLVVPTPPLRAITTKPTTKRIEVGLDSAFRAIADRGNGITDDVTTAVTWISTNPTVATVQATGPQAGLVHPVAPGTTRIVARDKATGIANTDGATEVRARGVSLSVEPSTLVLPTRLGFPMRCYVNRADGSRSNITEGVSWSSSSPSVAVSQSAPSKGVVQASVESEATIDCTDPLRRLSTTGVSGARVTVGGRLVGLSVEPDPLVLGVGETRSARAIGLLADGVETSDLADAVDWSIAPGAVATVETAPGDRGEVAGVAPGTATLRATEPTTGITSAAVNNVLVLGEFASLVIDAGEGIVGRGETLDLRARATWPSGYSSNLTEKCTWSTSQRSVATVTNSAPRGRLAGVARGDVIVTADCSGGRATAKVRVAGDVVGLRLSPGSWQGEALGVKRFKAIATYEDGHERDASEVVAWTSSAPANVDFDPAVAGSARLLEAGPAVLTARHPAGRSATASVLVTPGIVVLEILPSSRRLHGSDFARLRAQGRRADGTTRPLTKQVTWRSDDERIARVGARPGEIGMIFGGNRLGTTSVRATLPGSGFAAAIPVTVDVLLESFELVPAERTIPALSTRIVEARGRFTDGSVAKINRSVVYATSDPAVAVVSNDPGRQGEVTAIAPGKATITAVDVSSGKAARNALSVTVTPP